MTHTLKNIAVFGSTGSIGRNALEVIQASQGELQAVALSAHANFDLLVSQARQHRPRWVIAADAAAAQRYDWSQLPSETELLVGPEALEEIAAREEVDIVLAAIVGSAGLRSTWAAVEAGKRVALANKETLVVAGSLVISRALERGAQIIPVDSEHSAIFQALKAGRAEEVKRIVLTASGGPFRCYTKEQLEQVTVDEALAHPTWAMGPKITIDSATMMNKSLEIIEAHWLFGMPAERISVVVHPQSIVHSLVEFVDGSLVAQLSPPDMKLPIQYALFYPQRKGGVAEKLDLTHPWNLQFEPPDQERFPALELGLEAARTGGTTGVVLNAANEAAVASFLAGELRFTEIVPACRRVLEEHHFEPHPSLQQLEKLDAWARQEVSRWVCS